MFIQTEGLNSSNLVFSRLQRSRLNATVCASRYWYSVASVCRRLSVCLWRYVLWL